MINLRRLVVTGFVLVGGVAAHAQSDEPSFRPRHFTLSAGWIFDGGYPVGESNAELRRNAAGTAPPFTLFRADSDFGHANGVEARIAYAITPGVAIEVGAGYAKPRLAIVIAPDSEASDPGSIVDEITQYTIDVTGVIQLPRMKLGARTRPYATVGVGYLRQLDQERLLIETGRIYHVGGGIRYWIRGGSATSRSWGLRADARYVRRTGGIDFEDRARGHPSFSLLAFAGF